MLFILIILFISILLLLLFFIPFILYPIIPLSLIHPIYTLKFVIVLAIFIFCSPFTPLAHPGYSIHELLHYLIHPTSILFFHLHPKIQLHSGYIFICSIRVHWFFHPNTLINLHYPCYHILIHFNNHIRCGIFLNLIEIAIERSYPNTWNFPLTGSNIGD